MLQYVIDLGYFQMIPMGASEMGVPATRRKRLREHDAAWQRFQYNQKYTLPPIMLGPVFDVLGGVHCSTVSRRSESIHFASMPFGADSDDLRSWSCATTSMENFAFCPVQGLLVVVTRSPDFWSHAYDIHLKSLTTNDVHPDAAQPILKALDKDIIDRAMLEPTGVNVHIMGKYISMLMWNESMACMQMWDWKFKNGYQFSLLFTNGVHDCTFIAEDRFLVLDTDWTMEIYSITDKSKPPRCTAKLSLPSLMGPFSYTMAFAGKNITPSSMLSYPQRSYQPLCSFTFNPSTNDHVIAIHIQASFRYTLYRYTFFTLRSAILELENLFARTYGQPALGGPKLLWSTWGPQHTTWFQTRFFRDSFCGFRIVEPINNPLADPREPRRLRIRDFNPHIARDYHAQDKSDCRGRLVQGELTNEISRPFTEPLGSALSYREIVSEEFFEADDVLVNESRILLLKHDGNGEVQKIDVLVF
ncbi:hypothetical protein EDB19DRAFT_1672301 [Suillus lakei]|nr:hypothetical protein EDB19DRAFT_1672301 [Suillus lakei]